MRQTSVTLLALLALGLGSVRAESTDPSDHFLTAYLTCQKGEKSEAAGNFTGAMQSYKQAVAECDSISERWPTWSPPIVKHRREIAFEAINRIKPKVGRLGDKPNDTDLEGPLPNTSTEPSLTPDEIPAPERPTRKPEQRATAPIASGDPIREIQNRLESLQNDLASTKNKLQQVTSEKEDLAKRYEETVKDAEKSVKMQAKLQTRADRAEEALLKSETDGAKSSDATRALRAEVNTVKKELRDLQIDREAGEELRQQMADRLAVARKKGEQVSAELDAAKKASAETPAKIAEMQKQIDKALKEKGDVGTKLAKTEESLKKVTDERNVAMAQVEKLKDAQKQIDKLLSDNTSLMAKLGESEKLITQFKADGANKDAQLASLKKDVTSAKQQLSETQKQSATYQQQMSDLQAKLETQSKDLATIKTDATTGLAERKKLGEENEVLRSIVVREMKEQARRDQTKKLVLGELAKLEVQSRTLLQRIDLLGQPIIKLTDKERKLFKKPLIEISEAEISIAAPKDPVIDPSAPPTAASAEPSAAEPTDKPAAPAQAEPEANPARPSSTTPGPTTPAVQEEPSKAVSTKEPAKTDTAKADTVEDSKADKKLANKPTEKASGKEGGPVVSTNVVPNVPPELLGLANEGKELFERGQYREAEKTYEKILAKAPNNLYALSNLGVVRFRSGKLKLAEEAFKKAIAIAPEDGFSHCTLGIIYYSTKNFDEAVNTLTKAIQIQPKNATAHNYLGITASEKGWQEAAHKELETATALDPNYADAFFNLAVVYATQHPPNKEAARKNYKRATELGAEPDGSLDLLLK